jgi:hypothetical protein
MRGSLTRPARTGIPTRVAVGERSLADRPTEVAGRHALGPERGRADICAAEHPTLRIVWSVASAHLDLAAGATQRLLDAVGYVNPDQMVTTSAIPLRV